MKKPVISVIVTSYNDAEKLPKCLEALLGQTLKGIEIIGVDDASSDDTTKVFEKFSRKDARVRHLRNAENIGLAASRNRGLDEAKAELVMFCDADDYYEPTACAEMYRAITENETDLAISEIRVIYQAHREMKRSDDIYYTLKYNGRQQITSHLIFNTDLSSTNKIFRKSVLDEHGIRFPEGRRYEDAYFCVAYFVVSKSVYYVNKPLYNYVRHAGSIMSQTWSKETKQDHAIDHLYIAFELYDYMERVGVLERYNDLYWCLFGSFAAFAINNSKSRARVKVVRLRMREFVQAHRGSFDRAAVAEQEHVRHLSRGGFYISSARVKQVLLKLMPTYKLAIDNIQKLCTLSNRNRQLMEEIDKLAGPK